MQLQGCFRAVAAEEALQAPHLRRCGRRRTPLHHPYRGRHGCARRCAQTRTAHSAAIALSSLGWSPLATKRSVNALPLWLRRNFTRGLLFGADGVDDEWPGWDSTGTSERTVLLPQTVGAASAR